MTFEELEAKYNELLFAVAHKHPGESRHETALRYIRQAEYRPYILDGGQRHGVQGNPADYPCSEIVLQVAMPCVLKASEEP
jgi:hypothetical protein